MHDTINNKYYKVEFSQWTNGGGAHDGFFGYNRSEILVDEPIGVNFADGTYQPTAFLGTTKKYNISHIGEYSGHELTAGEGGQVIYFDNTQVTLTSNTENDCPVGTFYTLIAGNIPSDLRIKQYANVDLIPTLETQIEPVIDEYGNVDYPLNANSIGLLIKTDENTWTLSPTGIQQKLKGSVYSTSASPVAGTLLVDADIGKLVAGVDSAIAWTVDVADAIWTFDTDGSLKFPDASIQSGASISIAELKLLVADSTDFADFQLIISNL
jgi:hypothetical protein